MPSKVPSNSKYNDPLSQLNIQAREFLGEKKKNRHPGRNDSRSQARVC
jgi:hypothetical protein